MEKKKLLLVTISVGVFLVIVIGASIVVFSPRNPAPAVTAAVTPQLPIPAGASGTLSADGLPGVAGSPVPAPEGGSSTGGDQPFSQGQPATMDPREMVINSDNYQSLQNPPASSFPAPENRASSTGGAVQPAGGEQNGGESTAPVVINVPRPQTAAVPNVSSSPRPSPAPAARTNGGSRTSRTTDSSSASKPASNAGNSAAPVTRPASQRSAPAAAGSTAAQPVVYAPAARPAASSAARSVSQPQSRGYDAYWVQTGSFPTKIQADKAKEILAGKGLTAIIENGDVKGELWYRVRIGPYTSQNEADYWLALIKEMNGEPYIDLASSIVWKSYIRP
ncbi:MAG: SPOR domain-containing protein [Spirochaetaceae bacterium]|jgi:DedD protein|nr:SPOR domain-containing protein [Spirochaetaceae bacterium]